MTRKYKSIQTLQKACVNQITLENILHCRAYHKKAGWITINSLMNEELAQEIVDLLGGHYVTREAIKRSLLYSGKSLNHWGLNRIIYNEKRKSFFYCTGQDCIQELKEIRNALK